MCEQGKSGTVTLNTDTVHYEVEIDSTPATEVFIFDTKKEAVECYLDLKSKQVPVVLRKIITYSVKESVITDKDEVLLRLSQMYDVVQKLKQSPEKFEGAKRAQRACLESEGILRWILYGGNLEH